MNPLKHGLAAAKQIVIRGEDPEEFADFRAALLIDLVPANTIEGTLADRVVGLLWRLRRAPMVEAEVLQGLMNPSAGDLSRLSDEELDQLEHLLRKSLGMEGTPSITDVVDDHVPGGEKQNKAAQLPKKVETLSIFLRHETTLMNMLIKTLGVLRTLQSDRAAVEAEVHTIDGQRV